MRHFHYTRRRVAISRTAFSTHLPQRASVENARPMNPVPLLPEEELRGEDEVEEEEAAEDVGDAVSER